LGEGLGMGAVRPKISTTDNEQEIPELKPKHLTLKTIKNFPQLNLKTEHSKLPRPALSRKGQMKIAPDGVRGELRRIGSIKSPIGTTEKIAALSYFHSSSQNFILYGLPF
jgi:hypothetical protein